MARRAEDDRAEQHSQLLDLHRKTPRRARLSVSYFEYVGDDFDADMARMAADEETQRWWAVCKPLLRPVVALPPGEVWTPLGEVFHTH